MDFSKFLPNILPRGKIDKKLMRTFVKPERSAALSAILMPTLLR